MRQLVKRALRACGAGRSWAQPLFRTLHRAALFGRNFGEGDFRWSGEFAAMRRVQRQRPAAMVIFDVGANFGGWAMEATRLWPNATVHAFEPAEEVFQRLRSATADRNVRCVHAGMSDQPGVATLFVADGHPGLSSLHQRDLDRYGVTMTASEDVPLITLDNYCAENGIDKVDFLKIDVEGHDLAVLKGARRMLDARKIAVIQFEFGGANIDSRTYLRDFVDLLTPRYRLSRIVGAGVEPVRYSEREEIFVTANCLAELGNEPGH